MPYQLPTGPNLTPTPAQLINPDLLGFVWNNSNLAIYNASKAPIAGETFGIKNSYLAIGAMVLVGVVLLSGRGR